MIDGMISRFPLDVPLVAALLLIAPLRGQDAVAERVSYGENKAAGRSERINGIDLYHESYGKGAPLLVLHPNGGNIAVMSPQIAHFSTKRRVIAVDNRGHGKTPAGDTPLNYRVIARDMIGLLDHLDIEQTDILGWSDGGILALLIAIEQPERVRKMVIMGANLDPGGAYQWARDDLAKRRARAAEKLAAGDKSADWNLEIQRFDLMLEQPDIAAADLAKITAPVLVVAGDKDVIKPEHTQLIFESLPKAHLCIIPGATHMLPNTRPKTFNSFSERFLVQPFRRDDTRDYFE